jgi:drug/metabolite transporter (DMT)-like permease
MFPIPIVTTLGLAAAMAWGASDFSGGLSAKRASVWWVVLLSQVIGLIFLIIMAFAFRETFPGRTDLLLGGLAGIVGEFGLILLYQGLAVGRMGVVAPLSAVLSALLPAGVSMLVEGIPLPIQLAGIGLALPAVWLLASGGEHGRVKTSELFFGLGAGVSFGGYFILIAQVSHRAVFWPLAAARLASLIMILPIVFILRPTPKPTLRNLPLIAVAGLLDSSGNLFYALATRAGRLDVAAVLASLYPATTVFLAALFLHERLARSQWIGVTLALAAIVLLGI